MSANNNQFRTAAYLGAGGIFVGLLVFIFLASPDTRRRLHLPGGQAAAENARAPFTTGSGDRRRSGKRLSDHSDSSADPNGTADPNDPSLPGEVVIKAASMEELARLFTRALAAGGQYKSHIPALLAARIQFPTREAAEKFRNSLSEGELADQNYIVMAPDFPDPGGSTTPGDRSQATPTDQLKSFGDHALEFLGVTGDNSAWGKDVTIAILDSGVYPHQSLTGINIQQLDLVQTAENPDADYTGHGTAVADIAHLVAPSADILSVRVLDSEGIGDTFTVAQGIIAATDNHANVINLSLGSYGDSMVLRDAINYASERGVAIVAATGNDGIGQVSYPAAYDQVIGVTAVDATGTFADFSNYGDSVDLGAPGVGIYTAWEQDGQVSFSGTSAASPFVAAAIAATLTRNEGYTVSQAAARLQQNARDAGEVGTDPQTGNGILNLGE